MRILSILFFFITTSVSANGWMYDMEQAQKVALGTNKLILVDFWASWCGPCKKMDQESWSDPKVRGLMNNFVPLKIDIDRNRAVASIYGIRAIPYIFIMDANGVVIFQSKGYMNKGEVKEVLENYSLSTKYLQREALNYYRHQNYITSLRLAEKYLDFCLYLEEDTRKDFAMVAKSYLKSGEKSLDKKMKNYEMVKEKIELSEALASLYSGKYEKVERLVGKKDLADIDSNNHLLFAFLKRALSRQDNFIQEEKWAEVFTAKNNEAYQVRWQKFVNGPEINTAAVSQ